VALLASNPRLGRNYFWDTWLGDGTTTQRNTLVDVVGLTGDVSAIAAGYSHTCALISGGVKCWGDNAEGQLGDNSTTQRNTPVDVSGLTSGVSAIAAGYSHTCALTGGGGVQCWGRNIEGQLGDNSNTQRNIPVDVSGLTSGIAAAMIFVSAAPLLSATKSGMVGTAKLT
jgi:alpha-tubulin suppressor-like RCC1 family protein